MTEKRAWFYDFLFICILLIAGYLRLTGVEWGEGYHQHPDELFLTGVLDNLRAHTCDDPLIPVDVCPPEQKRWLSIGEYFDSAASTLSPYNRGNAFFVYGNLPMTLVRYAMEMTGNDDIGKSKFFARQFSALADLFTIFILYLIVSNLYGRRTGLFAAVFSSFAVMQIQQSHFFTTDLFTNLFMFLAIYFAVTIVDYRENRNQELGIGDRKLEIENRESDNPETDDSRLPAKRPDSRITNYALSIIRNPLFLLSIGFGFALGMAMASKINAAVLAILLPGAFLVRYFMHDHKNSESLKTDIVPAGGYWKLITLFLIAGGLATIISFRIFQPYAFSGLGLNPQWVANISEQRTQASGDADLPWNLQWARRSHLYSFANLTVWGLGLPLGILAWAGFLLMGWRILKGEWKHLLLWGWTAFYFLWQSIQFNATMRYQLPVYPLLCMMAAWFLFELPKLESEKSRFKLFEILAASLGVVVLVTTTIWAFAFQSIYLREETRVAASRWIFQNAAGPVNIRIQTADNTIYNQPLPVPLEMSIQAGAPFNINFAPNRDGKVSEIVLGHAVDSASPSAIVLTLSPASSPDVVLARASELVDFHSTNDPRGPSVSFSFDNAVPLAKGQSYILKIETLGSSLSLSGANLANETDYDWGLPFRIDNYDSFGGLYRGDLNLQVYWDDNADKVTRFVQTLGQTDYIIIPTNHQYGQITRLPERYPLTTLYYRELLGCPQDEDIIQCYRVAQPGKYKGGLGFELAAVFESYPQFGPIMIDDQSAEEAFTFYDHPKVLIFKKTGDFDVDKLSVLLNTVDLTKVVHLTPKQVSNYKDLLLPDARLAAQRAGGTWSELFNYDWVQNKYPFVGVLLWYAFIFVLGLVAYPITRSALPGLRQYAYPLSRIVGLALLAWISWMGGSVGVSYSRASIGAAFVIIAVAGFGLWMIRKDQFKEEWNASRKFFTLVEVVFVLFFLIDLLIRLGNSDMWHPSKGGERPMDFSYFNAVLKSTSFPPYDPWFAGGYINYYYYGFVLAGTPVKLLGIVPSIAYNFILPTWFALIAIGAFAVAYSLVAKDKDSTFDLQPSALISGLSASVMAVFLGNLGTIQMIFQAFQRMAAPGGVIPADVTLWQRWIWAFQGMFLMTGGALPIGRGEWYWNPSRVIPPGPGNEITEFPLFTFLYSDLHAHMLVIPLTLFIIAWAVSFIKSHAKMSRTEWIAAFGIGALMIGALKPTNTWDLYTFFPFTSLAVIYAINRHFEWKGRFNLPDWLGRVLLSIGVVLVLYLLGSLMYSPFDAWYSQAYNKVDPWSASHTPLSSYFTHWGLFLFIIGAWLIWEMREWMAATPISHLKKLRPYSLLIEIGLALVLALFAFFAIKGARIVWLALPLAVMAGLLILRPNMPGVKRGVLLMIGTGLAITLAVEVITLRGDIGRMNTVFKLYMQVWILFSVSAAAAFGWLLNAFPQWTARWRTVYQSGLYLLLAGTFMFTITATTDKISDRLTPTAPHTLDGITYMKTSEHWDGQLMDLSEDYRAIRWMQDHVKGSPVIVEANCPEYRWCTRYTIYTGLPGVLGWNWHQRQQRALIAPNIITDRVAEIGTFYTTNDIEWARAFLKKYQVKYIVVGQLEHNIYPPIEHTPDGLIKFEQYEGKYWKAVYRDKNTILYEVLP
jgi:YYY domain-containing protein